MSASFDRLAKVSASTKRPPAMSGGMRGEPETQIASLRCTPLDPADSQRARDLAFRLRQELDSPFVLLQTFVDASLDIREGDVLIVLGAEYPIRDVGSWAWDGSDYLHLLVEASRP